MRSPIEFVKKKRSWFLLSAGILFLVLDIFGVFLFSPNLHIVLPFIAFSFSIIIPFLLILFLAFFGIIASLFSSTIQGFICALLVVVYLCLRLFGITHYLFLILLLGVFGCIEFALYKKK